MGYSNNTINESTLIGFLGRDPSGRILNNDREVSNFAMATEERWTEDGQEFKRVDWHQISVYGKLAGVANRYCAKGRHVLIKGKLRTDVWDNEHGERQYRTYVEVDSRNGTLMLLDAPPEAEQEQQQQNGSRQSQNRQPVAPRGQQQTRQPAKPPAKGKAPAKAGANRR